MESRFSAERREGFQRDLDRFKDELRDIQQTLRRLDGKLAELSRARDSASTPR